MAALHQDGTIGLLVNGTSYLYGVDAAKHAHIQALMKHTPGRALDYIKRNANWYKKEERMTPAQQAIDNHQPFIHVYEAVCGWKPQVRIWIKDDTFEEEGGYWDVGEVGLIGHPTKEAAIKEGKSWAETEGLPFIE